MKNKSFTVNYVQKSSTKCQPKTQFFTSEIGWIGYMASYNGIFYNSYSGIGSDGKDYVRASIENILK